MLLLCLAACGVSRAGKVQTPAGMKIQRGRNYREVIEDFEDKGFSNIRTEKIQDLQYGWNFKNGQVEEISVGGDSNYDAGVWVPQETEVVIRYHTFVTYIPDDTIEEPDGTGEEPADGNVQEDSAGNAQEAPEQAGQDDSAGN